MCHRRNRASKAHRFVVFLNIRNLPPQPFRLLPLVSIFRALPPLLRTATVCQQLKNSGSYVAHIHAVKLPPMGKAHQRNAGRIKLLRLLMQGDNHKTTSEAQFWLFLSGCAYVLRPNSPGITHDIDETLRASRVLPAGWPATGRQRRKNSLFMKIFRDPCPVSLLINYMKNIKKAFFLNRTCAKNEH